MKKIVAVLFIFCLFLSACSGTSKLVGDWVDQYGDEYTFYKDGTVSVNALGIPVTGTFEFIENDTVKISLDGLFGIAGATIYEISFSDDTVTLVSDLVELQLTKQ